MIFGFHTGDLNPIWTVPMLGTHKARLDNRWGLSLFSHDSLYFQHPPCHRSAVPPQRCQRLNVRPRTGAFDTAMKTDCVEPPPATKSSTLACVVCIVLAIPLGLISVLFTLMMLLANMNIHFSSSPQLGMFLAGWTFFGSGFVATYRLLRRPGFQSLWYLVPPVICLGMIRWLDAFPENQHLMH